MSVKPDRWIRKMALEHKMIEPFEDRQVRDGVISYGVSSYGYDIRVADEFRIFTNVNSTIVDPKHFDSRSLVEFKGAECLVPPNSFALGRSVEYFRIPRNVLTICLGKSTYARCGIIVNVTPFEPEWEGFVTLEISNTTPLPGEDLRQRRPVPGSLLRVRRGMRNFLQGQKGEVPGAAGHRAAAALVRIFPGNAILPNGGSQNANREIGVPRLKQHQLASIHLPPGHPRFRPWRDSSESRVCASPRSLPKAGGFA